jgi:hypothetical protein
MVVQEQFSIGSESKRTLLTQASNIRPRTDPIFIMAKPEHLAIPKQGQGGVDFKTNFERAALESGQTAADMRAILQTPPDAAALARLSMDPRYNSTTH